MNNLGGGSDPKSDPPPPFFAFRVLVPLLLLFVAFLVFWFASAPTISITH